MQQNCNLLKGLGFFFISAFCAATPVAAQQNTELDKGTVPLKERWAFKTNAIHWIGLTPNVGVEFDITNSIYNKWTIGAQASWNGNTDIKSGKKVNFALNDYRMEVRRYIKPSLRSKDGSRRTPKFWRTYYVGLYAGYTQGDILLKKGFNMKAAHAGLTGGWEVQLYRCKHGAIDLDLGLSVGMLYGKYSKYKMENGEPVYTEQTDKHFIKYPLPTDFRIGFVYRFKSIKYKYNNTRSK